jgi:hypothetical protein
MKMKILKLRNLFLVLMTGIILSACTKDEAAKVDLVGTWTAGTPTITIMIGTKTLMQYFTDVLGLSPTEAAQYNNLFTTGIQEGFTGTIQFKSDNTFTTNMGGEPDSGTWSLSDDGNKLTVDPATDVPMTFDIIELTANKLRFKMVESSSDDLNGDEIPETMTITIELSFTR